MKMREIKFEYVMLCVLMGLVCKGIGYFIIPFMLKTMMLISLPFYIVGLVLLYYNTEQNKDEE
jgi:hypothetical protein